MQFFHYLIIFIFFIIIQTIMLNFSINFDLLNFIIKALIFNFIIINVIVVFFVTFICYFFQFYLKY